MKADPATIKRLLKTARGQLDGILNMVEEDQYCMDISHQLLACEAVLRKANREIVRSHMESCVRESLTGGNPGDSERKIGEIIGLIDKMTK